MDVDPNAFMHHVDPTDDFQLTLVLEMVDRARTDPALRFRVSLHGDVVVFSCSLVTYRLCSAAKRHAALAWVFVDECRETIARV